MPMLRSFPEPTGDRAVDKFPSVPDLPGAVVLSEVCSLWNAGVRRRPWFMEIV